MSAPLTRNFCIIAHVDHGEDHALRPDPRETTNTIAHRVMTDQHLDSMDLERERGDHDQVPLPVTMTYPAKDGKTYKLNLMDTPGPRGLLL